MIDFSHKWDELDISHRNGAVIRISAEHQLDLFIGYSDSGDRLLKLRSKEAVFSCAELPQFENITLTVDGNEGMCELNVVLVDCQLKDLFSSIVYDLASASSLAKTESGAAQVFLKRLERWAVLLEERKHCGLSLSQQLGLLGELSFLVQALEKKIVSPETAVLGWRGPEGDSRDILLGSISVEVKTTLASARSVLRISSLDQLDTENRRLIVTRYQFSKSDAGVSIGSLVDYIDSLLKDNSSLRLDFWRKLFLLGYDPDADYVHFFYMLLGRVLYLVDSGFPRLIRSNVDSAIRTASYEVDCSMLGEFIVSEDEMEKLICGY